LPPVPTNTPRPRPTPRLRPTFTPIPPLPTFTPITYKRIAPVPTDTPYIAPTFTPVVRRYKRVPTATPIPEVKPTATLVMVSVPTAPETIVFVNPPVNIDVTFADGPGRYKLEITDASGNHVVNLYDKQVGFERETWLSWDGKNDQGNLLSYGQYYALFSKDGKLIHKIALSWIQPSQ